MVLFLNRGSDLNDVSTEFVSLLSFFKFAVPPNMSDLCIVLAIILLLNEA